MSAHGDSELFGASSMLFGGLSAQTRGTVPDRSGEDGSVEASLMGLGLMDPLGDACFAGEWGSLTNCKQQPSRAARPAHIELCELTKAAQRALITAAKKNLQAVRVFGKPSLPGAWQGCPSSPWCNCSQDHLGPCNTRATIPGLAAYGDILEWMTDDEDEDDTSRAAGLESEDVTGLHGQDSSACTTHHQQDDAHDSAGCDGSALHCGLLTSMPSHSLGPEQQPAAAHPVARSSSLGAMVTAAQPVPIKEEPRAISLPASAICSPVAASLLLPTGSSPASELPDSLWPANMGVGCSMHPFCPFECCPGATNVEVLEAPDDSPAADANAPSLLVGSCLFSNGLFSSSSSCDGPAQMPAGWIPQPSSAAHAAGGHKERRRALRAVRSLPNFSKKPQAQGQAALAGSNTAAKQEAGGTAAGAAWGAGVDVNLLPETVAPVPPTTNTNSRRVVIHCPAKSQHAQHAQPKHGELARCMSSVSVLSGPSETSTPHGSHAGLGMATNGSSDSLSEAGLVQVGSMCPAAPGLGDLSQQLAVALGVPPEGLAGLGSNTDAAAAAPGSTCPGMVPVLPPGPVPQPPAHISGSNSSRLPEVPPPQTNGAKKRSGPPVSTCARPVPNPRGPDVGCTACGSTVTPVWRAGPQGPKTLCNACGVRYMKVAKRR